MALPGISDAGPNHTDDGSAKLTHWLFATHTPQELARVRILKAVNRIVRGDDAAARRASEVNTLDEYLRPKLTELRDCRVSLGLASLRLGDPAEAGRQQRAAASLVAQYQLGAGRVNYLWQLLQQAKTPPRAYAWQSHVGQHHAVPVREHLVRKHLRPELTELRDCHVSLGLASLQLGDSAEAGRQERAAAGLVTQYQLEEAGVSYLSQLVAQANPTPKSGSAASRARGKAPQVSQRKNPQGLYGEPPPTPPTREPARVFGTF